MRRSLFHLDGIRNSFSTVKPFLLLSVLSFNNILDKPNLFIPLHSFHCAASSFVLNYTPREQ